MKHKTENIMKKYIFAAPLLAAAVTLSGCSIIQGTKGTPVTSQPNNAVAAAPAATPSAGTQATSAQKQEKKQEKKHKNHNKNNKPAVSAPGNTGKTVANLAEAIAGEWFITSAGSKVINQEEDMPYINFDTAENRFYGFNGCNTLNGSYTTGNEGTISFSNVLSTMRFCAGNDYEAQINDVFQDGSKVSASVKRIGNDTYLYLSRAGRTLLTLSRHNLKFLDGYWLVKSINGKAVEDEEANIFFDLTSLKVHGNTGCNFFNGNILVDPQGSNAISFSGMGVTRMACPKGDQERNMLVALEEATTVVEGNNDTAILLDDTGRQVLTLKRGQIQKDNQ